MKKPRKRKIDVVPQSTAAKELGVSRQAVHKWIISGHIRPINALGQRWVSLKECRAYMASKEKRKGQPDN